MCGHSSAVMKVTSSQMSVTLTVAAVLSWWWHQVKWVWHWQQWCHWGDIKSNDGDSGSSAVVVVTSRRGGHCQLLQMLHEHLQTDIICQDRGSRFLQHHQHLQNLHHLSGQRLPIPATPPTLAKFTSSVRTEAPDFCDTTTTCKPTSSVRTESPDSCNTNTTCKPTSSVRTESPDSCNTNTTCKPTSSVRTDSLIPATAPTLVNWCHATKWKTLWTKWQALL